MGLADGLATRLREAVAARHGELAELTQALVRERSLRGEEEGACSTTQAGCARERASGRCLPARPRRADEQAARFDHNRHRIEEACGEAGPALFAVQANRVVQVFPAPDQARCGASHGG